MNDHAAQYQAMPVLSPYARTDRYDAPKEDHKFIAGELRRLVDVRAPLRVGDLGCGNGELIYYLRTMFPHWDFSGFDCTREFIDTARGFEGLAGVRFAERDLFEVQDSFELVLCTGVANIFEEIDGLLNKLLAVCAPRGVILVDGLFNQYPVDVRVRFCDNSLPASQGVWRTAFNQHSRRTVSELLEGRVESFEFADMVMDKDLPFDSENPAVNSFTFRDSAGRNIITNGLNLILNRTLLVIKTTN